MSESGTYGLVILLGNGTGTGAGTKWKVQYSVEMFTLVRGRDGDLNLLFPIVPFLFFVPAPV